MVQFKKSLGWVMVLLMSFLGGMSAQILFPLRHAVAQSKDVLRAERLYFTGPDGRNGGQVYFVDGSGAVISLNAADERQRIQIGTYNGPGEKGLPLIGLSDNSGALRLLFRLAGSNQSPLMIFKDRQGRDRMVIGLGLNDPGEEPFISYIEKDGTKKTLMGAY